MKLNIHSTQLSLSGFFIKAYVYWKIAVHQKGGFFLLAFSFTHKTLLTHQPPFRDLLLSNTSEYYLLSLSGSK